MNAEPEAQVHAALDRLWRGGALGLAVSGGGDSMALMLIAANWAKARGAKIFIATVDHQLRPESASEALQVAAAATRLDFPHMTLVWRDWDRQGNLQAAARNARRRLLAEWAAQHRLEAVALGHTLDDQAETVLMRLGRGAGVDGLSAMAEDVVASGMRWLRPMLPLRREALRAWLREAGAQWIDDPSNENDAYDRVKARRAIAALQDLGVTAEGLSETASRMRSAREALDHSEAELAAQAAVWGRCGELRLALDPIRRAPAELARRLLRTGLTRASGADYGPRAEAERTLLTAILGLQLGGGRSLHGCLIRPKGAGHVVISREPAAMGAADEMPSDGQLWDGRFRIDALQANSDTKIRPLGAQGARRLLALGEAGEWQAPSFWREAPAAARIATPALWRGDSLLASPIAGYGNGLSAEFAHNHADWRVTA